MLKNHPKCRNSPRNIISGQENAHANSLDRSFSKKTFFGSIFQKIANFSGPVVSTSPIPTVERVWAGFFDWNVFREQINARKRSFRSGMGSESLRLRSASKSPNPLGFQVTFSNLVFVVQTLAKWSESTIVLKRTKIIIFGSGGAQNELFPQKYATFSGNFSR